MSTQVTCDRCEHPVEDHWSPEQPPRTTACLTCLDAQNTTTWNGRTGICDHTAEWVLHPW